MPMKPDDMTQVMALTTRKGVGSLRWQQPVWVDFLPPCNHACPAGEDIQGWLALAQAGQHEAAWRKLVESHMDADPFFVSLDAGTGDETADALETWLDEHAGRLGQNGGLKMRDAPAPAGTGA